jgi:hypothetical protein
VHSGESPQYRCGTTLPRRAEQDQGNRRARTVATSTA